MQAPVIFAVRYSVLVSGGAFELSKLPPDDYREQLFDPHRLAVHHHLFSTLTVPSLALQAEQGGVFLHVSTSSELPYEARAALDATLAPFPWAQVIEVYPDGTASESKLDLIAGAFAETGVPAPALYAHCRLDDDDAVSSDFVERLRSYIRPAFAGMVVSFGTGHDIAYDAARGCYTGLYRRYTPKIAIGLARVARFRAGSRRVLTSMGMGSHMRVDLTTPTILDSRSPSYLRTLYLEQDTAARQLPKVGEPEDPAAIAHLFPHVELPTLDESIALKERVSHPRP